VDFESANSTCRIEYYALRKMSSVTANEQFLLAARLSVGYGNGDAIARRGVQN
jgi:hypothetical protein